MQQDNSFFDLNGGQLEEIQNKYALLEPLVDTYLSESEKREYSRQYAVQQTWHFRKDPQTIPSEIQRRRDLHSYP
ncbi:hypothetical protein ES705_31372 [subsurface metagenome]